MTEYIRIIIRCSLPLTFLWVARIPLASTNKAYACLKNTTPLKAGFEMGQNYISLSDLQPFVHPLSISFRLVGYHEKKTCV